MKNILVLGGTRFFGRKLVELLIEDGHKVTLLTRGKSGNPFGDQVEHLTADRTDKEELARAVEGRSFDLAYDNICYSPIEAYQFCKIFNGRIKQLVFTSTLSVYKPDGSIKIEEDFNPYTYNFQMGDAIDFDYGEGKRQAEAVYYKYAEFPTSAVRFPIVMGEDDYTQRLHFHIERILKGEPIGFINMDAEMGFIQADEAARFLKWAGLESIDGPVNAAADGFISLAGLINLIEAAAGKTAAIQMDGPQEIQSPYAIPDSWYMSNQKATELGFSFTSLNDWLHPLIQSIAAKLS